MLDHHSASDLVRLRSALLNAQRLAGDRSEVGRHTALIALDGVCEYAMWLSIQYLGLTLKPAANWHDMLSRLGDAHKATWKQPGRRGVVQMHAARNQAQHGGALPDPALLSDWRDATDSFVRSLVSSSYEHELDEVLLADAVSDIALRGLIAQSERELNAGRVDTALGAAVVALDDARRRWRDQQHDAYGLMALYAPFDDPPEMLDASSRATDYADISVFADDLSEYHWLLATRRQIALGIAPTADDASRALRFAYHWILRWQQFDAAYPRSRWQEQHAAVAPPVAGDGVTPQIVGMHAGARQKIGDRVWHEVTLEVANLPDRGRSDWGHDLTRALHLAAETHGVSIGDVIASQRLPLSGQFKFFFDPELAGDCAAAVLTTTVVNATKLFADRRRDAAELEQRVTDIASGLASGFTEDGAAIFGELGVTPHVRDDGEVFIVEVDFRGSADELAHCAQIFRGLGGTLASASFADMRLTLEASLEPDRQRVEIARAVESCVTHVRHVRELARLDEEQDVRFVYDLERALGLRPGDSPAKSA
jgi:hypothetical protein